MQERMTYPALFRSVLTAFCLSIGYGQPALTAETGVDCCLEHKNPFDQLLCLVEIAKGRDNPELCAATDHPGVHWQCIAIMAEHRRDRSLCDTIPRNSDDLRGLRDKCLSDVALVRKDATLCHDIGTPGLRDSCYLKIVNDTGDKSLCSEINDLTLRSACAGEPIYID